MKKLLAVLLASLLLGVGALGMAGCGETPEKTNQEEPPPDEPVLEYGFGDGGGYPQLSYKCGYVLTQTEFAKDDVFLEVYYGEIDGGYTPDYIVLRLYMRLAWKFGENDTWRDDAILMKELNSDEFNKPEYIWQGKDTHHETMRIPEELFTEPSGRIAFCMQLYDTIQEKEYAMVSCAVDYQLTEDRVTLSVPTK